MNNWPEIHAEFCRNNPHAPLWFAYTPAAAMIRLERQLKIMKAFHQEEEMSDDERYEAMLEKKTYLRGPEGAYDRATIWQAGTGTIGGAGGLIVGQNTRLHVRPIDVISDDDLPGQSSFLE